MRILSKLIYAPFVSLILITALLSASLAQAQDATQEAATSEVGSASQLRLRRPLLGMQLIDTLVTPNFYQGLTLGGGETYIALGGTCVNGYTQTLPAVGLAWVNASGPVQIGFNATDPSTPTAIILWDQPSQQWWCNDSFSQGNFVGFQNIEPGIYFMWVLTEDTQTVLGSAFVRAPATP